MRERIRDLCAWLSRRFAAWAGHEVEISRGLHLDESPLATVVTLTLDRPRKLRFTMREAAEFRRRTGVSVWTGEGTPDGMGLNFAALSEDHLLELLTVCCLNEDPEVTADELAEYLAGEKLKEVVAALMVLVSDFLPEVSEDDPANPLVAGALIHLMSGSTGRSPRKPSDSRSGTTGGLPRA
ncbi:MAG: hypothetical protein ACOC9T_00300 [Myxococcota bacterium]